MVLVVLMNDSCCIRIVSCSYCFIIDDFYDFVPLAVFVDLTLTELADGFGLMVLMVLVVLMVLMVIIGFGGFDGFGGFGGFGGFDGFGGFGGFGGYHWFWWF